MAKLFGMERAARDIASKLEARVLSHGQFLQSSFRDCGYDSPLEALFHISFSRYFDLFCEEHGILNEVGGIEKDLSFQPGFDFYAGRQINIEGMRVDFLYALHDQTGRVHWLVVECDGHDFHERTKEQAKKDRGRDRRLQSLGYTVMRFTGSEIYSDPVKCVIEILDWARSKKWIFE